MTQTALEVHFGSPSGLGQAGTLLYTDRLAPIVYSGRPIGINSTKSSSTSVGAREVGSGGEGLYGRPRPVPLAHPWGNALPPPAPGDHQGPPFPTSSALAPTNRPDSF